GYAAGRSCFRGRRRRWHGRRRTLRLSLRLLAPLFCLLLALLECLHPALGLAPLAHVALEGSSSSHGYLRLCSATFVAGKRARFKHERTAARVGVRTSSSPSSAGTNSYRPGNRFI